MQCCRMALDHFTSKFPYVLANIALLKKFFRYQNILNIIISKASTCVCQLITFYQKSKKKINDSKMRMGVNRCDKMTKNSITNAVYFKIVFTLSVLLLRNHIARCFFS